MKKREQTSKKRALVIFTVVLAVLLFVSLIVNIYQWRLSVSQKLNFYSYAHVYGWVKELWTDKPIANVRIHFFLVKPSEDFYSKMIMGWYSYATTTNDDGFYTLTFGYYESEQLYVMAEKLTFYTYEPETIFYTFCLYHVLNLVAVYNFTMAQLGSG